MLKPLTAIQKAALYALLGVMLLSVAWLAYHRGRPPRSTAAYPTGTRERGTPKITVDVEGAVNAPGIYVLHLGDRALQAMEAAGGFTPSADRTSVNLATRLADGGKVIVREVKTTSGLPFGRSRSAPATPPATAVGPVPATPPAGAKPARGPAGPATSTLVSLNTATQPQLEQLPGVDPATAQAILAYRQRQPFRRVEELLLIPGIGRAEFIKLKPRVTL